MADETHDACYTIDELARLSGVTARNIRTFQVHGMLPGPTRRGRLGYYSDLHLTRLQLIERLQVQGFSRAAIGSLMQAWDDGRDLTHVLGVERLASPLDSIDSALALEACDAIAHHYVEMFMTRIWEPYEARGAPEQELDQVTESLRRLTPLVHATVHAGLDQAMAAATADALRRILALSRQRPTARATTPTLQERPGHQDLP